MIIGDLNVTGLGIVGSAPALPGTTGGTAKNAASGSKLAPSSAATAGGASTTTATLLSAVYTTTVGGKRYSGSVSHADGLYTISVPNVPGATVTATSLQAAEAELYNRIDELA